MKLRGIPSLLILLFLNNLCLNNCLLSAGSRLAPASSNDTIAEEIEGKISGSKKGLTRRKFIKDTLLGLFGLAVMPSFLKAQDNDKATDDYQPPTLNMAHLNSLSKNEIKEYFEKIDKILQQGDVLNGEIGRFLSQVFNESYIVWIRAEAVKLLVRHNLIGFEEAKKIVDVVPERLILESICEALAENPEQDVILYLKERMGIETGVNTSRLSFNSALKNIEVIPEQLSDEIIQFSRRDDFYNYRYTGGVGYTVEDFGILAAKNGRAYKLLLEDAARIAGDAGKYSIYQALALSKKSEAENLLLAYSRDSVRMESDAHSIVNALLDIGTPKAINRITELSYEIVKYPDMLNGVIRALVKVNTQDSARKVVELIEMFEQDELQVLSFASYIGKINFPEVKRKILELSRSESRFVRKLINYALQDMDNEVGEQRLLEVLKNSSENFEVKHSAAICLGQLGTKNAKSALFDVFERGVKTRDIQAVSMALLALSYSTDDQTLRWIISKIPSLSEYASNFQTDEVFSFFNKSVNLLFDLAGYRSFELLSIEVARNTGQAAYSLKLAVEHAMEFLNNSLWSYNQLVDVDVAVGEKQIYIFANRLKRYPEVLFLLIALSREVTSHSFPVFFKQFNDYLIDRYGWADFPKYIKENFGGQYIANYLFTITIFGELENALQNLSVGIDSLPDVIFSEQNLEIFMEKPSLFAKLVGSINMFKSGVIRDLFNNKIIKLATQSDQYKYLLKLMFEFKYLGDIDPTLAGLLKSVELPELNPVWSGPVEKWIAPDGVLSVGLYWAQSTKNEVAHYSQFTDIFARGRDIQRIYSEFTGYKDLTAKKNYAEKIKEFGAEKVLVKEFPKTKRKVEIYLYPNLDNIKQSRHAITISRGHAGSEGNTDYPGIKGGLRVASHCRSVDDVDTLIDANNESAVISITGTGRAVETNPLLYYLFEYMGRKQSWGDWNEVKSYIAPHIRNSIQKYNFPLDDISSLYAVMLKKVKQKMVPRVGTSEFINSFLVGGIASSL